MISLDDIPENPGIYIMKSKGKIIYIGKAKILKRRVMSYFHKNHDNAPKTKELVKKIEDIDYILTNNEIEALILENNLIKKYSPKYNIALKDEKTYPYIKITKEKFPKIEIIRSTKRINGSKEELFGPYPMGVYKFIKAVKRVLKLRDCKRDMTKIYQRPCLKYNMGMCSGPCVYKNVEKEYREKIEELRDILKGKYQNLIKEFEKKMYEYSEKLEFEKAIVYKEKIEAVKNLKNSLTMEYGQNVDEDVFVVVQKNMKIFIYILNVREGKILGKNFIDVDLKLEENGELDNIFIQYYSKFPMPKNIILEEKFESSAKILESWSKISKTKKINIFFPKIKSRRLNLLEMAKLNLNKEIEKFYNKKENLERGLYKLREELHLKKIPMRIECFDISNIQGKDAVGSMSVAIEGKNIPKEYRRFKITVKDTPDDFKMMEEVLTRRYSKLKEYELPQLILIDGGLGQLGIAEKVLKSVGKFEYLDIISIAKREELIYKAEEKEPYVFLKSEEALKILQRLRDESHRFGITYHRKLRSKRVLKSELDDIKGIGTIRKNRLLKKFKTVEKIKKSSLEELSEIIPTEIAKKILKLKN
ncbi:excinuclease ABC subunit UvrC [Haliovirga abyssi]|uniref:UvrABC system protein C n=1 Tax=Haliovirga abyssi TaxID=2996794 RepID=A0AAU9DJU9_9FUSO|nr:excinuclease ABC subunit UvrC [Haliovirga abyssi]BDU50157.1 UvrABC system protein C [Haliovirga abyssi]